MKNWNRREFMLAAAAAGSLSGQGVANPRIGVVRSTHAKLPRPSSPEDKLDYERVRDMVWKAIEYGRPRAGSLEQKIRPGSWVVIKPNIVTLRPSTGYRTGDITDFRVTKAVVEYVARRSKAARITVAEGGTYRRPGDPAKDNVHVQNGVHVDARTFDWGTDEFPGFGGSLNGMLAEFAAGFPNHKFDYVDLSYDAVRDASGKFRRIPVPRAAGGIGAFAEKQEYFVTNTITNCDFLISVPVMKVHEQCGITVCFKNYVGTAPREAYAEPGSFSNGILHKEHSVDERIDPFIADLAAFHPPDYNVVDALRGLQYTEHNNNRPDQMIQSNLILAGEDTVAMDSLAARLMGFNVPDIEFLHMAAARGLGVMDLNKVQVSGDDPGKFERRWIRPRMWYGRCNREWLVSGDASRPLAAWSRYRSPVDTLRFQKCLPEAKAAETTFGAAAKVNSQGNQKTFLWVGFRGKLNVMLNGEQVMSEENVTRYRVGQFRKPVELRQGENLLVFRVQAPPERAQLSALLVDRNNEGDSVEGIRWFA